MKALVKKLNSAIESVDEKLKVNGEVIGIVIFRFKEDHNGNMMALGEVCMHCIAVKAALEHLKSTTSKHDQLSSAKEAGIAY